MDEKKLTICFLGSAGSIHMLKWAKYFSEKGHKVYLFSYDPVLENYDLGNIETHLLKKKFPIQVWPLNTLLNLPFVSANVKKIIKEVKPDVVHAHYVTSYGTLSALVGSHPLIITAWGSDVLLSSQKHWIAKLIIKHVLKKADLITCDAEHIKETMVRFGVPVSKIKIINFGIDIQKFNLGPKDSGLAKNIDSLNSKIVISLRNLYPVYDIGTLIRAIPIILKELPGTKFLIAGSGPQEQELKKLAEDLNIMGNTKFLGKILNDDLPEYLRLSDVYVSTSLSDGGIAASTAEAMACGLPVVITDTGDNKDWVKNNENGFLIPTKKPEALAKKVVCLLKNKEFCSKFGAANRKIVEERNDYYKEMEKMEIIYKQLSGKK